MTRKRRGQPSIQEKVTSSLESKFLNLPRDWYWHCCIHQVPDRFRRAKKESYTPRIVSIGPLHHGQTHLQPMELYKLRYCESFLLETSMDYRTLVSQATLWEEEVRQHYQAIIKLTKEEFVEMILLDGVFILVLFLRNVFPGMFKDCHKMFPNDWMHKDLLHDLMLLENQLPSLVPINLLNLIRDKLPCEKTFLELGHLVPENLLNLIHDKMPREITFLELGHLYFYHTNATRNPMGALDIHHHNAQRRHLLEYLQNSLLMSYVLTWPGTTGKIEYNRCATELHEAGIRFVRCKTNCLLDIRFAEGVLAIPKLHVNEWTETLFRNLIAFEQCGHDQTKYISGYIIFMDKLIDTRKDVELLAQSGIIDNSLGETERVANLFNNLHKETIAEYGVFYYGDICQRLNDYSRDYWHQLKAKGYRWKSILKREYFDTPWKIIAIIVSAVMVGLTTAQTVCSILSVLPENA